MEHAEWTPRKFHNGRLLEKLLMFVVFKTVLKNFFVLRHCLETPGESFFAIQTHKFIPFFIKEILYNMGILQYNVYPKIDRWS